MAIPDRARAEQWLRHISGYWLSAYWLSFENPKGHAGPRLKAGTHFHATIDLYEFDRRLWLHVLNAIERIEVAIRSSWAYALAHHAGPHGYLNAALYSDRRRFHDNFARLDREVDTSPETYIDHYRHTYDDPGMPRVWMVAEMMSFGQLSRWYLTLGDRAVRKSDRATAWPPRNGPGPINETSGDSAKQLRPPCSIAAVSFACGCRRNQPP